MQFCDEEGKPTSLWLSGGNVSDYKGVEELLKTTPKAKYLL
jgi:hypothetical protein